jgi:CheY-like chemotaxis protein
MVLETLLGETINHFQSFRAHSDWHRYCSSGGMNPSFPQARLSHRAASPQGGERTPPGDPSAPADDRSLAGLRVLLVEDDAPSLKLLEAILRIEGCEVRSTRSAEEALDVLATFRPTVAVIDIVLPLVSGLLLAEKLKATPATSNVILLAVTAFNGSAAERTALAAGFSRYVRKPIDPNAFPALLLDAVRGAQ